MVRSLAGDVLVMNLERKANFIVLINCIKSYNKNSAKLYQNCRVSSTMTKEEEKKALACIRVRAEREEESNIRALPFLR